MFSCRRFHRLRCLSTIIFSIKHKWIAYKLHAICTVDYITLYYFHLMEVFCSYLSKHVVTETWKYNFFLVLLFCVITFWIWRLLKIPVIFIISDGNVERYLFIKFNDNTLKKPTFVSSTISVFVKKELNNIEYWTKN